MWHHLRRDQLCGDAVTYCEKATAVLCTACGKTWAPDDIGRPGTCPNCGVRSYQKFHQNGCDVCRLDEAMDSDTGRRIYRGVELLNALEAGFSVGLDDVTAEAFADLMSLRTERDKYLAEKQPEENARHR